MSLDKEEQGGKFNPLLKMAVITGATSVVNLHLRRGTDLNCRDEKGMSLLMYAAMRGNEKTCHLLLEAGANPFLINNDGKDALSLANEHGKRQVEAVLLRYAQKLKQLEKCETEPKNTDVISSPENIVLSGDVSYPSGWEVEVVSPPPAEDPSCIPDAKDLQRCISLHVPIDTYEDWSDVTLISLK